MNMANIINIFVFRGNNMNVQKEDKVWMFGKNVLRESALFDRKRRGIQKYRK